VRVDSREETSNTLQNAVCCSMLQVCCSEGGLEGRPSSLLIVLSLRTWETRVTRVLLSLRDMTLFTLVSHVRRDSTLGERQHSCHSCLADVCLCERQVTRVSPLLSLSLRKLIERNPPPRGGFLFAIFPHQEPCVRGPPRRTWYKSFKGGPLTHGS